MPSSSAIEARKSSPKVSGVAIATPAVAVSPGVAPKMMPMPTPPTIHSHSSGSRRIASAESQSAA